MTRKLIVTLEFDMSSMSDDELMDAGWEDDEDGEEGSPGVSDYDAREIASLIPYIFNDETVAAEMFAGSNIFLRVDGVRVATQKWGDE